MSKELLYTYRNMVASIEKLCIDHETELEISPPEEVKGTLIYRVLYIINSLRDRIEELEEGSEHDGDEIGEEDKEYTPPPIISVTPVKRDNTNYYLVQFTAATENSFLVSTEGVDSYAVLKRVCHTVPILWHLDGDMMEAFDDAGRTKPSNGEMVISYQFSRAYKFSEVNCGLPGFDELDFNGDMIPGVKKLNESLQG